MGTMMEKLRAERDAPRARVERADRRTQEAIDDAMKCKRRAEDAEAERDAAVQRADAYHPFLRDLSRVEDHDELLDRVREYEKQIVTCLQEGKNCIVCMDR